MHRDHSIAFEAPGQLRNQFVAPPLEQEETRTPGFEVRSELFQALEEELHAMR